MCSCRPEIRTPCCGAKCHEYLRIGTNACEWCSRTIRINMGVSCCAQARAEERAQIVGWLRSFKDCGLAQSYADAIEAGAAAKCFGV